MNKQTKKFLTENAIFIVAGLAALLLVIYYTGLLGTRNNDVDDVRVNDVDVTLEDGTRVDTDPEIVVTDPVTNATDVVGNTPTTRPVPVAGDGLAYTTTESGLQYRAISTQEGTQVSPTATDTVEVYYHGTLEDGTVFDSAYERNESIRFGLNQVIRGWTEGLQYMQEGDVYEFSIPAELAYGAQGRPGIPGGATLNFVVELVNVVGK